MFLGGSFVSLVVMGLLFARGLGAIVLRFENAHAWFVPGVEAVAGLALLGIAGALIWRMKKGKLSIEPSANLAQRLQLGSWRLGVLGALLVAVQSVVDVVFLVAMVRVGQLRLSSITLLIAVVTYALAALVLQLAVVVAYKLTPPQQRSKTLDKVHELLTKYAHQVLIGASLLLGCVLLALAVYR